MLFLGLDLSTQQVKVIATNEKLEAKGTFSVEFDTEFKDKYGVTKGVISGENGTIVSPVLMWLDALDLLFERMKTDGFPFDQVHGISGSCQQHGSIFWSSNGLHSLSSLSTESSLSDQLKDSFAYKYSPNWQDHSTQAEITSFEKCTGGASQLAEITGSRAHFRFTGLQIRKLVKDGSSKYANTHRISLVSSFLESVLLGKYANIEQADACGMNLYDIKKSAYDEELLSCAAGVNPKLDGATEAQKTAGVDDLLSKLGLVKPISYKSTGLISPYFAKYGFNKDCRIYSFTGDNLATIISLPLAPNDCLISLGTSTTVLVVTAQYKPSSQYHLFKHPTMPEHYMGMICYCNGSLAREKVRDDLNSKYNLPKNSWDKFDEILDKSHKFSSKLGIYFPLGEIVPSVEAQTRRFSNTLDEVEWDVESDVVSIVESQTLSCRLRTGPMLAPEKTASKELREIYSKLTKDGPLVTDGKEQTFESITSRPRRCFFVGGASNNASIVRKMGSIFSPLEGNYKVDIPNACALGGAYKASWSARCESIESWVSYDKYISGLFSQMQKIEVEDQWFEYFSGLGLLARVEERL